MNGESYRSLYNTTMSFGPKYDGSDVLYWDGKMRPYLPATDNPWKELFRTGWNHLAGYGDQQQPLLLHLHG